MLTSIMMQIVIASMTSSPAQVDLQKIHSVSLNGSQQPVCVAYYNGPIHGPDPDREIHDYGMPSNNPDPYGGTTRNGADPYGGRFGGNDPYGGRTGNALGPYGR